MIKENLIPAKEFCKVHKIETSFISSLHENGFIEVTTIESESYIHEKQLKDLEKIIRLHYDLDINLEGIETIINLLERIDDLRHEIIRLQNTLRLYETSDFS